MQRNRTFIERPRMQKGTIVKAKTFTSPFENNDNTVLHQIDLIKGNFSEKQMYTPDNASAKAKRFAFDYSTEDVLQKVASLGSGTLGGRIRTPKASNISKGF